MSKLCFLSGAFESVLHFDSDDTKIASEAGYQSLISGKK
jgi:hypothetical protein